MLLKRMSVAVLCLAFGLGCELNPLHEPPVRVMGKVTWRGQPIRRGSIVFAADPDRNDHQELAVGLFHFDGSYELSTPEGLPPRPGWYRVTLLSEDPAAPLPANYADPALSGFNSIIVGPGPQRIDWNLP